MFFSILSMSVCWVLQHTKSTSEQRHKLTVAFHQFHVHPNSCGITMKDMHIFGTLVPLGIWHDCLFTEEA